VVFLMLMERVPLRGWVIEEARRTSLPLTRTSVRKPPIRVYPPVCESATNPPDPAELPCTRW